VPVGAVLDAFGNLLVNPETGTGAGVTGYSYDAAGKTECMTTPTGTQVTYSCSCYDPGHA
jgi:YD repeat-containing protein